MSFPSSEHCLRRGFDEICPSSSSSILLATLREKTDAASVVHVHHDTSVVGSCCMFLGRPSPHMRLGPQTSAPQPGDFAAQAFSAVCFRAPTAKPILPETRLSPELPVSSAPLLRGSPIPVQIEACIRGRPGIPICLHSHFERHCAFISDMVFRSVSRYRR
jgi:hypothetical protein